MATVETTETGIAIVDGETRIEVARSEIGALINAAAVKADTVEEAKAALIAALSEDPTVDIKVQQAMQRFMRADNVRKVELRRKLKDIQDRAQAAARAAAGVILSEADALKAEGKDAMREAELVKAEGQAP